MCKDEGIAVTRAMAELKAAGRPAKSLWGRAYMAHRMKELSGRAAAGTVMHLPEHAWLAWVKREEGYDRFVNGVEEAKLMWSAGCQHYGLVRNADGERVLPVLVRGQIHCTDAVLESATCAAPAEGGAERSSRLELNVAPSGPASADEGVPAALGATHSTDWSPANDGPGGVFRKTTRMSCVPLSFLSRAIARPSSPCPAPSWESGTSTLCPVLLALAVVCGADVCGGVCSRQLRSIVLR